MNHCLTRDIDGQSFIQVFSSGRVIRNSAMVNICFRNGKHIIYGTIFLDGETRSLKGRCPHAVYNNVSIFSVNESTGNSRRSIITNSSKKSL